MYPTSGKHFMLDDQLPHQSILVQQTGLEKRKCQLVECKQSTKEPQLKPQDKNWWIWWSVWCTCSLKSQ